MRPARCSASAARGTGRLADAPNQSTYPRVPSLRSRGASEAMPAETENSSGIVPVLNSGFSIRPIRIEKPEFRTGTIPLEFSVSAGIASIAPRDLNDGTRGYVDWFGASANLPVPRAADALHLAGLIGFEISYRFS